MGSEWQKWLRPSLRLLWMAPDALMEIYACHEKAISYLIL